MKKQFSLIVLISLMFFFHLDGRAQMTPEWSKVMASPAFESWGGILKYPDGSYLLNARLHAVTDVDPGPGVTMVDPGVGMLCLLKFDRNGNLLASANFLPFSSSPSIRAGRLDRDGNFYITGIFQGTQDVMPGPGVYTLGAAGYNLFVAKFSPSFGLLWANSINSPTSNGPVPSGLVLDKDENIYICGTGRNTVDFDPGPGVYMHACSPTVGWSGYFLEKLDSTGTFQWVRSAQSATGDNHGLGVTVTEGGGVILLGGFNFYADFDAGPGVAGLSYSGPYGGAYFIMRMDASGNCTWARRFGAFPYSIPSMTRCRSEFSDFWIAAAFSDTTDLDPGPGVTSFPATSVNNMFVSRFDTMGDLKQCFPIYGDGVLSSTALVQDGSHNLYLGAFFGDSLDADPSPGILRVASNGGNDFMVAKYDSAGRCVYAGNMGSVSDDYLISLALEDPDTLLMTGSFTADIDLDPSPLPADTFMVTCPFPGSTDVFFAKFAQSACSTFFATIDSSCDVSCTLPGFGSIIAGAGRLPYSYLWSDSASTTTSGCTIPTPGVYSVVVTDSMGCSHSRALVISGPDTTDIDLEIFSVSPIEASPADTLVFQYLVRNGGCLTTNSGLWVVANDPLGHWAFTSADPTPAYLSNDSVYWSLPLLNYDSLPYPLKVFQRVDTTATMGEVIRLTASVSVDPLEVDTLDNQLETETVIASSYDPNDKQVHPIGECDAHLVDKSSPLTYTIRFQNTGTAAASEVNILDSLDGSLDLFTTNVKAASHYHITEVLDGGVLRFRFPGIDLPDSATNEPLSHGFVVFEVKPKAGVLDGTIVKNKSAIYFDYNPAVITNEVMNTLMDLVPSPPVTYLAASVCLGDSFTFPDGWHISEVTDTIIHSSALLTLWGCDSFVVTTLMPQNVVTGVVVGPDSIMAVATGALYQWLDCNDGLAPIPGAVSQVFHPTSDGLYAVSVTQGGCVDTSACTPFLMVDTDLQISGISVSPVPADDILLITAADMMKDLKVFLIDGHGRVLVSLDCPSPGSIQMDVSGFPGGVYHLQIEHAGRRLHRRVLIR